MSPAPGNVHNRAELVQIKTLPEIASEFFFSKVRVADFLINREEQMNNFEENLAKLEELTNDIKKTDISLEDALKDFEEGIRLARGMEKEIDRIEGKIQQLMNNPSPQDAEPAELDLFSGLGSDGTAGAPVLGTRQ